MLLHIHEHKRTFFIRYSGAADVSAYDVIFSACHGCQAFLCGLAMDASPSANANASVAYWHQLTSQHTNTACTAHFQHKRRSGSGAIPSPTERVWVNASFGEDQS